MAVINILFSLLTFIMFTCTSQLLPVKLLLLGVILLILYKQGKINYSFETLQWILIYLFINLYFLIEGQLNGGRAFQIYGMLYIIEPILYFAIIIPAVLQINESTVNKTLLFSFDFVNIIVFLAYIARKYDLLPLLNALQSLPCTIVTDNRFGYISVSSVSLSGFFFLIPYFVTMFFKTENKKKPIYGISALFGLLNAILVGRRTLILVGILSVLVYFFLNHCGKGLQSKGVALNPKKHLSYIVIVLLLIVGGAYYFQKNSSSMRLGNLSSSLVAAGDNDREIEKKAMLNEWEDNPILGTGYAINAEGSVRSEVDGTYEYSYLSMLFQTGIIGTVLYFGLYLYLIFQIYKYYRLSGSKYYLAVCVGFISLLIGNATNPYMASFDGMWSLFYCLALVNKSKVGEFADAKAGQYLNSNI